MIGNYDHLIGENKISKWLGLATAVTYASGSCSLQDMTPALLFAGAAYLHDREVSKLESKSMRESIFGLSD